MHPAFTDNSTQKAISIFPVISNQLEKWRSLQLPHVQQWMMATQFKADPGTFCLVPHHDGTLQCVLLGITDADDFWSFGALPSKLPEGDYSIDENNILKNKDHYQQSAMAWGLGFYQFTKYKKPQLRLARLVLHKSVDVKPLMDTLAAIELARDLINTPAEDMGPDALEKAVQAVGKKFEATVSVIKGDKLLKENYPAIYTVGRASPREPRVIDLHWGNKDAPQVTLVGKGVCFDSGGLNIKVLNTMLLMKKDMAGSAMMLALAYLIMSQNLPIQLRLLIGAVDNAISGNAYRPGDIITTRSGKTVEITNTDAEGRLVLCDLLTEASASHPDTIIDFATLTGAARVALGEDIPALYAQPQAFADELLKSSQMTRDILWQLPLVPHYKDKLKSNIADMVNCAESVYGGSITAALFLQAFVGEKINWAHVDVPAWHFQDKPGRPAGADVFGVRAMFAYLKNKYQ